MVLLIAGLLVFLGVHLLPTFPTKREVLIARIGLLPYKALFTVVSLAGFLMIIYGKAQAPYVAIWEPPMFLRHITMLLVLLAFIALVATYVPSNTKRILKHPMLVAIKLWALGHLLANGDLASLCLFGGFLAFAIYDRISVKRRGVMPAMQHRPVYMDALVVIIALVAYGAVVMHHYQLFGVPVMAIS